MNIQHNLRLPGLIVMLNLLILSGAAGEPLREMSTDRPDTTESPYTVNTGYLQLEMSFLNYVKEDLSEEYSWMPFNLKVGLMHDVDIQFVVEPQIARKAKADRGSSLGDSQVRLKKNLWGNDEGDTALAFMPYIQLPTGGDKFTSDHFEWGMIFPFAIALPHDLNLGLMAEFDFVRNNADNGFNSEFLHSATMGFPIIGELGGYLEYVGISPLDTNDAYQSIANGGLTYTLTDDIQLDCGGGYGLSESAPDLNLFMGISIRG